MANTVVGLFDSDAEAQRAVRELLNSGFDRNDIGLTASSYMNDDGGSSATTGTTATGEGIGERISHFFSSLFGSNDTERSGYYSEAVRRGGIVVTVDADTTDQASRAAEILDRNGAVDINARAEQYRASGYTGYDTAAPAADEATRDRETYRAGSLNESGTVAVPVVEEELQVGKREVERGGVRVRSHVVERPVEEVVRLREERVQVERRPVNRPVTEDYLNAFQEGTIEITETQEVPVVAKEARVVEEVVVNKEVGERTETVRDTVRRSDVEVEQLNTDAAASTTTNTKGTTSR